MPLTAKQMNQIQVASKIKFTAPHMARFGKGVVLGFYTPHTLLVQLITPNAYPTTITTHIGWIAPVTD